MALGAPGTDTDGTWTRTPAALATVDLAGGGIAAAALTAAYLGAHRGVVTPDDVAAATTWELAKHGRASTR